MAQERKITATDFSVFGTIDANGNLKALSTQEAIENAFRMWVVSKKGEVIRFPNRGGFLYPWLMKPMTEVNVNRFKISILNGLEQDFFPYIKVNTLEISPDYNSRVWNIHLVGFCPEYKTKVDSTVALSVASGV